MPQSLRVTWMVLAAVGVVGLLFYALVRSFKRSDDPARLVVKWVVTLLLSGVYLWFASSGVNSAAGAFMVAFGAVVLAVIFTPLWAPQIAAMLFRPLTSAFDGGDEEAEAGPLYSQAEARRRQGKFNEAIHAIHGQLQEFPTDLAGQLLLASIQAENMNDLPGAEVTVHRLCSQKNHAPSQIAGALGLLADWHLKLDQDPEAARAALQRIIDAYPDTELALGAANRIAHLGSTAMLIEAHDRPTLVLKPGVEYLGMMKDQSALMPQEKDCRIEAGELVKHLGVFPQDTGAREQLARIYGGKFGRLDLATDQLEQLIALPHEPPRHVARWLNLLADLQVTCTEDTERAAATIGRIIERFPNQSFADLARQRLASLRLEVKRYEKGRVVRLAPGLAPGDQA